VVYGSSANTRLVWDLSGARALGYAPQDDAETYAAGLLAAEGARPDPADPVTRLLGGEFCAADPPGLH
jgi:uronate dehydrogenase